jgi:hypothetical protein
VPVAAANILVEGQVVQLDLGGKTQAMPVRVLGFGGSSVMLAPLGALSAVTTEALGRGGPAYVIIDREGQIHALRAQLSTVADPGEIVVHVTDQFQLGQRRRYSRAPLHLTAKLRALGGEEWETVTRDISAGGLRLTRTGAAGEAADRIEVVLEAAQAGLRIAAQADVVRRTSADLSVRFVDLAPGDAALLQQIVVAYYRLG